MKIDLTQERLKELLRYDPDTGHFTWLVNIRGPAYVGRQAGATLNTGYISIKVDKTYYTGHRLACLYMTGAWPKEQVDHINGVRSDNRWSNLREATRSQNQLNQKLRTTSKTGVKGVYWSSHKRRFVAQFTTLGVRTLVGQFKTVEEAAAAIQAARESQHQEFARHK